MSDPAAVLAVDQFIEDANRQLGDQVWLYLAEPLLALAGAGRLPTWGSSGTLYPAHRTVEPDGTIRLTLALDIKPKKDA